MMENSTTKSQNNVILVDPNSININNLDNAIPNYEDMYIYVNLKAYKRSRSVLTINNTVKNVSVESQSEVDINLMGTNQNKNNPYFNTFTTNYYEGSEEDLVYDSFGITSINVNINSSYIPQINIKFVDVRGVSLFNQENSPYRILFDFPPPIFELTIKGYYGKPLTYKMHLVKYTTEFKADVGNFEIDANFVAVTYAPLSDVLFKYIINFPLMYDNSLNPNLNEPPKNTNELIEKLKILYSQGLNKIDGSIELNELKNINNIINNIESDEILLNSYSNNSLIEKLNPLLMVRNNITGEISKINSIHDYDRFIINNKSQNDKNVIDFGLFIGVYDGIVENPEKTIYNRIVSFTTNDKVVKLNNYRNNGIINRLSSVILNPGKYISLTQEITSNVNITNSNNVDTNIIHRYYGIDISKYYNKLKTTLINKRKEKNEVNSKINTSINSTILNNLGMQPTIYNIFKIILNDVDLFFRTLRFYSETAEAHHNDERYYNLIIGNDSQYKDVIDRIYSFPLIVKTSNLNNGSTQERIAPIDISNKLGGDGRFPELILVDNFINSFKRLVSLNKQFTVLSNQDDDGNYIWIPITPKDSTLPNNSNAVTPYYGIDVNNFDDMFLNKIFNILLKRYYVLSQFVLPISYNTDNNIDNSLFTINGIGEAVNLILSTTNSKNLDSLKLQAIKYKSSLNSFYSELSNYVGDLTNVRGEEYFDYYINKISDESKYNGFSFSENNIEIMNQYPEYLNKYVNEFNEKFFKKNFFRSKNMVFSLTSTNVLYVSDIDDDDKLSSKFLSVTSVITNEEINNINNRNITAIDEEYINKILASGNTSLYSGKLDDKIYIKYNNILNIWVDTFEAYDNNTIEMLTNLNINIKTILMLSSFGSLTSPFDKKYNDTIFSFPCVIEIPKYLQLYLGALLSINDDDINVLKEFYLKTNANISKKISRIFADIHDVKSNISTYDKEMLLSTYNIFKDSELNNLLINFDEIINKINNNYNDVDVEDIIEDKKYDDFFNTLSKKIYILNYSQNSFKNNLNSNIEYKSLNETLNNSINKKKNDIFFVTFFNELINNIDSEIKKRNEDENNFKKLSGDENIITQTYYSFKNINDKWISNPNNTINTYGNNDDIVNGIGGYPFNNEGKRLIDSFAFVDRAMNPIGDTIINPEILIELSQNYDISVFSVLSQILSENGFEFFPLQNFMKFENDIEWNESFKIDNSGKYNDNLTSFVCMYIGGSSSYPTGINKYNSFLDDGIVDISMAGNDFSTKDAKTVDDKEEQVINNSDFPYNQVRAFRVKFGEQNQSMFIDFKIDSKEYPETNESIQILSRLAGDEAQNGSIPKGQNLFNLYENRAYKATITALGNAMIQPTQYFQLENIPMFSGAYIILDVQHTIIPNKMETQFSGVKILQYPIPRVTNPSVIFGFDGGGTDETNAGINEQNNNNKKIGDSEFNDNKAKYNSMYTLKIKM